MSKTLYQPTNKLTGETGPKFDSKFIAALWILGSLKSSLGWDVQLVSAEPTLLEIQDQLLNYPAAARRND